MNVLTLFLEKKTMYNCDNIFFNFKYPGALDSSEIEPNDSSVLVCKNTITNDTFKNIIAFDLTEKIQINPDTNILLLEATHMKFAEIYSYILNRPNILVLVYQGTKNILDQIRAKFDFGKYENYNYIIIYKDKTNMDANILIMITLFVTYFSGK